jgi:hypothetical protein
MWDPFNRSPLMWYLTIHVFHQFTNAHFDVRGDSPQLSLQMTALTFAPTFPVLGGLMRKCSKKIPKPNSCDQIYFRETNYEHKNNRIMKS